MGLPMNEKKVRAKARPEDKTLRERRTEPTVPDGEAARVSRQRRQEREAVPRAPLDIEDGSRRKR
jgi:hypothetical protein